MDVDKRLTAVTVSTWLKKTIQAAYDTVQPDSALVARGRCAPELRALAASWAELNNFAMQDILDICHWSSSTVFTSFNDRDVSSLCEVMQSIGPMDHSMVIFGHVVCPADNAGQLR